MKPSCREVCEHATALLEGDLSGPEWDALRHHFSQCPPCGEYLRQIGLTVEAVRLLPGSCGDTTRAELVKRFEAWIDERARG